MHRLTGLAVLVFLTAGLLAASAASAASAIAGSGTCSPYIDGNVVPIPCSVVGNSGGSSGGNGGSIAVTCTITRLDQVQASGLGLQWPAPPGDSWALLSCFGGTSRSAPEVGLVRNATGAPQVTARQLLEQALGELRVPYLNPSTAPPRGKEGLVGLPEWFWIPASDWHPRTVTVRAGSEWAVVTASPSGLSFDPGGGLAQVSCKGPGLAYDPGRPVQWQQTACSYTYERPSLAQPGDAFQASVAVTWLISWTGSGGQGGVLTPALPLPVTFSLRVAQGEALVSSP